MTVKITLKNTEGEYDLDEYLIIYIWGDCFRLELVYIKKIISKN